MALAVVGIGMEIEGWEVVYKMEWSLLELWHLYCGPYDGLSKTVFQKEKQWFCQKCNVRVPQAILDLLLLAELVFYSPDLDEIDLKLNYSNLPSWVRVL